MMLDGPALQALSDMLVTFQTAVQAAGAKTTAPALTILAAGVLYQCVRAWMDSILDGDALELIEGVLNAVIVGTILTALITNYAAVTDAAWGLMSSTMAMFSSSGATSGGDVINTIWKLTTETAGTLFALILAPPTAQCGVDPLCWTAEVAGSFVTALPLAILMVIVVLLVLIYVLIMLLQVFRGIFQIGVGLLWLPLTLGFYPLIDSWAMSAVGLIASGIAHMAIVAFLLDLVSTMMGALATSIATGQINFTTLNLHAFGKLFATLLAAVMMVVMALSSGAAVGYATSIFGSVSGWTGIHRPRKGGGGDKGGGSKQPEKGTGETGGPSLTGPSGSDTGSKIASDPVGTAGKVATQAAAGVATGGATAAAGVAAAGATGGGAMQMLKGGMKGAASAMKSAGKAAGKQAGQTVQGGAGGKMAAGMNGFAAGVKAAKSGGSAAKAGVKAARAGGSVAGGAAKSAGAAMKIGGKAAASGVKAAGRGVARASGATVGMVATRAAINQGVKMAAQSFAKNMMHNH